MLSESKYQNATATARDHKAVRLRAFYGTIETNETRQKQRTCDVSETGRFTGIYSTYTMERYTLVNRQIYRDKVFVCKYPTMLSTMIKRSTG